jgi:hypothetical protein
MAGYYVDNAKCPLTVGYQPPGESFTENYYYQSARKFASADAEEKTLVTV